MYSNFILFFVRSTSRLDRTVENLAICDLWNCVRSEWYKCVFSRLRLVNNWKALYNFNDIDFLSLYPISNHENKIMYKETLCTLWKWLCHRTRLVLLLLLPPPNGSTEKERESAWVCACVWHHGICIVCGKSNRAHGHIRSIGQTESATACILYRFPFIVIIIINVCME